MSSMTILICDFTSLKASLSENATAMEVIYYLEKCYFTHHFLLQYLLFLNAMYAQVCQLKKEKFSK